MREREHHDEGFTLLEAVVAMVVFGIIASATAAVLVRSVGGASDNRARAAAANVAAQAMDSLRDSASGPDGYTALATRQLSDVTVQGRTYSVFATVTVATGTNQGSPCTAGGISNEIYRKVGVTVTWPNAGSVKPVRSDTIIQNPGVAADPARGAIGVIVSGPSGPQPRVSVSLNNGATALTDESGCAYFGGLAQGNYVATASAVGFVDEDGNSTESQTAGVQPATATVVNLAYAAASRPNLTYATVLADGSADASYLWPGSSKYALQNDSKDRAGTTAVRQTTPALYPFASGYNTWLGGCTSETGGTAFNFATPEGSAPDIVVPAGGLTITNTSNNAVTVNLAHTDATTTSCSTAYTVTVPARSSSKVTLPFGNWSPTVNNGLVGGVLTGQGVIKASTPSSVSLTGSTSVAAVTFS